MPEATHSVVVSRSPAEVFAFVADGENDKRWRPGVLDVRRESGQGAGAVYRQGVKGPFGRRVAADYEVTQFEPERRLAFQATSGPVRPRGVYEFESADGGTRVSLTLSWEPNGLARLMAPMVAKTMRSEVGALENLRGVLEEDAGTAGRFRPHG